jgi:hypothetical protein
MTKRKVAKIKKTSTKKQLKTGKHLNMTWKAFIISQYKHDNGKIELTAYPKELAKNGGTKSHDFRLMDYLTPETIVECKNRNLYLTGPKATYFKLSKKSYYNQDEIDIAIDALKFRLPDVIEFLEDK